MSDLAGAVSRITGYIDRVHPDTSDIIAAVMDGGPEKSVRVSDLRTLVNAVAEGPKVRNDLESVGGINVGSAWGDRVFTVSKSQDEGCVKLRIRDSDNRNIATGSFEVGSVITALVVFARNNGLKGFIEDPETYGAEVTVLQNRVSGLIREHVDTVNDLNERHGEVARELRERAEKAEARLAEIDAVRRDFYEVRGDWATPTGAKALKAKMEAAILGKPPFELPTEGNVRFTATTRDGGRVTFLSYAAGDKVIFLCEETGRMTETSSILNPAFFTDHKVIEELK